MQCYLWAIFCVHHLGVIFDAFFLFQLCPKSSCFCPLSMSEIQPRLCISLPACWSSHSICSVYSYPFKEKAMEPHSSTLAWKLPWTEEPGGLQSMGSQRVRQDCASSLSRIGEGNGNPLQCSCLENPRDGGVW